MASPCDPATAIFPAVTTSPLEAATVSLGPVPTVRSPPEWRVVVTVAELSVARSPVVILFANATVLVPLRLDRVMMSASPLMPIWLSVNRTDSTST